MAPKIQVQPGFMPPGDDVMALVAEVGGALRSILKNEQAVADLRKSEKVATGDPQSVNTHGDKGAPNVATSEAQTLKAERSPAETSSSGGGTLPVKKGEYSESSSSSASPMCKGSPSAEGSPPSASASAGSPSASPGDEGGMPPGDPSGAPPADPSAPPADAQAPAAGPSFEELVQMYSQLPPEDLQAHMAAIEQAAQAAGGAAGAPGGMPPSPGGMPPGGAPPDMGGGMPPSPGGMPPSAGGPPPSPGMPPMGKSERDSMFAELKKTQDQVASVAEALTAVLTMPQRKSVSGLSMIPYQGGALKKTDSARIPFAELRKNTTALHAELKKMTSCDSNLSKKERDLVTDFYCRRITVDELEPIFTEKK